MDHDVPDQSGKRDHQHGFPDDIFRASGEPEDSRIERSSTDSSDNEIHSATHPPYHFENGDQPLLFKDSVSSRSSSGSSADFFQFEQPKHRQELLLQDHSETATERDVKADIASSEPSKGAQVANEDPFFNPRKIPPIQVMDRSDSAFDPSRIPSSVFTPNSSNSPMDWSAASNESLFSLHVGNNSFSKDQFFMMGADFKKSGELFKSDDLHKSGELSKSGDILKSGELFSLSPSSPIPMVEMTDSGTPKVANSSPKDTNGEIPLKEDQAHSLPVSTSTISSHSDGSGVSGASARSFAFPM